MFDVRKTSYDHNNLLFCSIHITRDAIAYKYVPEKFCTVDGNTLACRPVCRPAFDLVLTRLSYNSE